MKITNRMLVRNWLFVLLILIIGLISVGVYIVISGNRMTEKATADFYTFNMNENKAALEREIQNRLDEIDYELEVILVAEKALLYDKINGISDLLSHSLIAQVEDFDERQRLIIEEYEHLVSQDDYLYFAMTPKGVMMRSGTDSNLNGVSLYDVQDSEGIYYVRIMAEAVSKEDGLYVDYYWPKVKDGKPLKKTAYVKYLPEYDLIIGTGAYHEDTDLALRERIYSRLQSYYEDKDDYIFVTGYDAIVKVHGNPDIIGQDMREIEDYDGSSLHARFMDVISSKGNGFVTYSIMKNGEDALSEKLSYVHELKDWDAYMGMGFNVDDLNREVAAYAEQFRRHYYTQALIVITSLILISLMAFTIIQRGAYLQRLFMQQGDVVFEKLFDLSSEAILVLDSSGALLFANENANHLFSNDISPYIVDGKLSLEHAEADIMSFTTTSGRQRFVTIKRESANFQNKEATVTFIHDITDEYLEKHALSAMAYKDELTGLPNRRSMMNDFEDLNFQHPREALVVGILDIDHFKHVNDTYGHNLGDQVLKLLADVFSNRSRYTDRLYRYGGEEFFVILKDTRLEEGKGMIEALNRLFDSSVLDTFGFNLTFSCGLKELDLSGASVPLTDVIPQVDRLLYQAKRKGRNRVEVEEESAL